VGTYYGSKTLQDVKYGAVANSHISGTAGNNVEIVDGNVMAVDVCDWSTSEKRGQPIIF